MNEHQTIEWKEVWRDEYLKWICGFANAQGGTLIIGKDDNGNTNAVVHKDYSSGIPIQISVYEDRIVFWNYGQLPEHWTLECLLGKHPSNPFNPLIANTFFRCGYIESWGLGIEKINRECEKWGIPPPEYDYGMSGLMLTFRANPTQLAESLGETRVEPAQESAQESAQEKIIQLINNEPHLTRHQLAQRLSLTPDSVKHHLQKLKTAGCIEHVGSTKAGYWRVLK